MTDDRREIERPTAGPRQDGDGGDERQKAMGTFKKRFGGVGGGGKKRPGAAAFGAVLLLLCAGCTSFQPIPGPGRDGGLYRYTADYRDEYLPFGLAGKALLEANQGEGFHFNPCTMALALFPGLPLYAVEQFAVCPLVDTALIPYDLALKLWEGHVCAHKGLKVVLTDSALRPVPGCEIAVIVDARFGYRVVYDGKPCPRGWYLASVTTDENGEAYVPIDMSSCEKVRLEGWAWTENGKEDFHAQVERELYWGPDGLKRWDEIGEENRVVLNLKGRLREDGTSRWPPGTLFAEGTTPGELLRKDHRSLGHELETRWATLSLPGKAADFDEVWDADVAAMRGDWGGEVEVEEMPEAGSPDLRFSRIVFDVGGRRVAGWLSEPTGGAPSEAAPTLAFFGRGPDPDPASLPRPTERTVLYLSVFEPGYDYHRGEWAVRDKYHISQGTWFEGYALDGIDEGLEAYFFHPVLSGAQRAVEWLAERTGSPRIRCVGTDQGAALALMTAALNPRVEEVAAHHPVFVDVMSENYQAWPEFRWHERSGRHDEARRWMPYYELCGFAGRVRCPVTLWLNMTETSAAPSLALLKSFPAGSETRLVLDSSLTATNVLRVLVSPEAPLAAARSIEPRGRPKAADGADRVAEWKVASFAEEEATPRVPEGVRGVVLPAGKGRREVRSAQGGMASVGVGMDPFRAETVVWNGAGRELWRGRTKWKAPAPVFRQGGGVQVWNGGDVAVPVRPLAGVLAWNGADVAVKPKGWKKGAKVEVFAWTLEGYGRELAQTAGEAVGSGTPAARFDAEADGGWWVVRWDAWPDAPGALRLYVFAVKEDADGDGLDDGREVVEWRTFPDRCDTDGDTRGDGLEGFLGSDPLSPYRDAGLTVNALWTDPEGAGGSWVELYSSLPHEVSLEGFRLETARDGEWRTVLAFPAGCSMPPGSTLLIGEKGVANADFHADLGFPAHWPATPACGVRLVWDGVACGNIADAVIVGRNHFPEKGGLDREGWDSDVGVRPKGNETIVRHYPGVDNNRSHDWTTRAGVAGRPAAAALDTDGDGLPDADEWSGRLNQPWGEPTNPYNPDSDGDGLGDREECCVHHTNPNAWASDGDIYPWTPQGTPVREWPGSDPYEIEHGWNPLVADENGNGIPDSWEMVLGTDALLGGADSDGDGISDLEEMRTNRNPRPGSPSR